MPTQRETLLALRERVLAEALTYFRPHPTANGPVILTPSKMREHLTVIEAALRQNQSLDAGERMREACAKVCDGIERGLLREAISYRPPFAFPDEELAYCCDQAAIQLHQAAEAIRALPLAQEGSGC